MSILVKNLFRLLCHPLPFNEPKQSPSIVINWQASGEYQVGRDGESEFWLSSSWISGNRFHVWNIESKAGVKIMNIISYISFKDWSKLFIWWYRSKPQCQESKEEVGFHLFLSRLQDILLSSSFISFPYSACWCPYFVHEINKESGDSWLPRRQ